MLAHRLATGTSLIAAFLAILLLDELWLAPWFPLWVAATSVALVVAAREIVGLLERTSARPSAGIVLGGVLAIAAANVLPHVAAHLAGTDAEAWSHDAAGWAMMFVIGVFGTVGHVLIVRAFAHAPASMLSPFFYLYLIWAVIYGWFFFGDLPGIATVVGGALIIASGIYVYRTK